MRQFTAAVATGVIAAAVFAHAQTGSSTRAVATLTSLMANAVFYHGKTVSILGSPVEAQGWSRIPTATTAQTLIVAWKDKAPPAGRVEVRGLFFDVGRFMPDDARLPAYGIPAIVRATRGDSWPARDTFFVLLNATAVPAPDQNDLGLRAVTLDPDRFDGKSVTLRGRFRGQNLYGDEPSWPRQSQWDFVLQSADAAIWATGLRPKGKDFDFDPRSRRNTDSWLEVTGVVKTAQGLPYIAVQSVKPAPTASDSPDAASDPAPVAAPPALIFSAPADGEVDVAPTDTVRVQFSRDMSAASFDDHVNVSYGPGASDPVPKFAVTYKASNLAIEIKFEQPLARFSTVVIQIGPGVTARDGTPMAPAKLGFSVGG